MEPRIAGSVSRATDSQGSPQGTGLVTAGIAPQLFQDLFYSHADAPQLLPPLVFKKKKLFYLIAVECSRVETVFTPID